MASVRKHNPLHSSARALQRVSNKPYRHCLNQLRALGDEPAKLAAKNNWPLTRACLFLVAPTYVAPAHVSERSCSECGATLPQNTNEGGPNNHSTICPDCAKQESTWAKASSKASANPFKVFDTIERSLGLNTPMMKALESPMFKAIERLDATRRLVDRALGASSTRALTGDSVSVSALLNGPGAKLAESSRYLAESAARFKSPAFLKIDETMASMKTMGQFGLSPMLASNPILEATRTLREITDPLRSVRGVFDSVKLRRR